MTPNHWDSEIERFLNLSADDRWRWFAKFLFAVMMLARSTYVAGGSGLAEPERMRRVNELTHRVAQQLRNFAIGSKGMPDAIFLKGVREELGLVGVKPESLVEMLK